MTRKKRRRARRKKTEESVGWQVWAVLGGVLLIVVIVGIALVRNGAPGPELDGTVVAKEVSARPGRWDRHHLRELTVEDSEGEKVTVEVEKWLYDAVEEGFYVRRTGEGGLLVRDAQGRDVTPTPAATGPGG